MSRKPRPDGSRQHSSRLFVLNSLHTLRPSPDSSSKSAHVLATSSNCDGIKLTLNAEFSSSKPLSLREAELLASRLVREAWQFYEDRKDGILSMYSPITRGERLSVPLRLAGSRPPSELGSRASDSTISATPGLRGTSWLARL